MEFFQLPVGVRALPAAEFYRSTPPNGLSLVANLGPNWRAGGVPELGGLRDYFGARLSGGLRVDLSGAYNFTCVADDACTVFVDGVQVRRAAGVRRLSGGSLGIRVIVCVMMCVVVIAGLLPRLIPVSPGKSAKVTEQGGKIASCPYLGERNAFAWSRHSQAVYGRV